MDGQRLKEKVLLAKVPLSTIAERMGITAQSLNSCFKGKDVRSNTIERIADALGVSMSFFYPADSNNTIASGDRAVAVNTNTGNISASNEDTVALKERISMLEQLLDERGKLLNEKERLIKILMNNK